MDILVVFITIIEIILVKIDSYSYIYCSNILLEWENFTNISKSQPP